MVDGLMVAFCGRTRALRDSSPPNGWRTVWQGAGVRQFSSCSVEKCLNLPALCSRTRALRDSSPPNGWITVWQGAGIRQFSNRSVENCLNPPWGHPNVEGPECDSYEDLDSRPAPRAPSPSVYVCSYRFVSTP